jgi:hypothetical protein
MQERVQALGGEFAIEASNGCGTCVRIVIPLPQSSGAAQPADSAKAPRDDVDGYEALETHAKTTHDLGSHHR